MSELRGHTKRKQTWVTISEISQKAEMSTEKAKAWLQSGNCPFGQGFTDSNGNFLCYVLRKDFNNWLEVNINE